MVLVEQSIVDLQKQLEHIEEVSSYQRQIMSRAVQDHLSKEREQQQLRQRVHTARENLETLKSRSASPSPARSHASPALSPMPSSGAPPRVAPSSSIAQADLEWPESTGIDADADFNFPDMPDDDAFGANPFPIDDEPAPAIHADAIPIAAEPDLPPAQPIAVSEAAPAVVAEPVAAPEPAPAQAAPVKKKKKKTKEPKKKKTKAAASAASEAAPAAVVAAPVDVPVPKASPPSQDFKVSASSNDASSSKPAVPTSPTPDMAAANLKVDQGDDEFPMFDDNIDDLEFPMGDEELGDDPGDANDWGGFGGDDDGGKMTAAEFAIPDTEATNPFGDEGAWGANEDPGGHGFEAPSGSQKGAAEEWPTFDDGAAEDADAWAEF